MDLKRGITLLCKIAIIDINKIEVLKELANEYFRPSEYEMITLSSKDYWEASDFDILINQTGDLDIDGAKRELFIELTRLTGYSPEWGTLTGVRPVKLAGELIESLGEKEAIDKLKNYYLLPEDKIQLITDMYKHQIDVFGKASSNSVSCYIGIPFCPTRCLYCSFASNQRDYSEIETYLEALIKEIKAISLKMKEKGLKPESIYIGGGTPTTLSSSDMGRLLKTVNDSFDFSELKEYTVEAGRPDTIDKDKLSVIKDFGVDRISINPQSMRENTLKLIGRDHSPSDIDRAFSEAKKLGFDSINCDLIAGLPEEDVSDMEYSLNRVMDLGADNITVHCLAVKKASRLIEEDPDYNYKRAQITRDMLKYADSVLKEKNYIPYYLYRQKHMAGSAENTGYCLRGKEGLYNVRIMDEHQTIIAMGAGGISKKYIPEINRLERIPNLTNYELYIERLDEMIERKDDIFKC